MIRPRNHCHPPSNILKNLPRFVETSVFIKFQVTRTRPDLRIFRLRTTRRQRGRVRRLRGLIIRLKKNSGRIEIICHGTTRPHRTTRFTQLLVTMGNTGLHRTRKRITMETRLTLMSLSIRKTIRQLRRGTLLYLPHLIIIHRRQRRVFSVILPITQGFRRVSPHGIKHRRKRVTPLNLLITRGNL